PDLVFQLPRAAAQYEGVRRLSALSKRLLAVRELAAPAVRRSQTPEEGMRSDYISWLPPSDLDRPRARVDAAARIHSTFAGRSKLRNTLPPLASNDLYGGASVIFQFYSLPAA